MRPQLQSRATTAVSKAEVQPSSQRETSANAATSSSVVRSPRSRAASIRGGRRASGAIEDFDDRASVVSLQSYLPSHDLGGDVYSLIGGFGGRRDNNAIEDLEFDPQKYQLDARVQEDFDFEDEFDTEFTELGELDADGSNEEELMIQWYAKLKHFFILSSAGKPIYSRHGDNQLIANSIGVIQTIISVFQASDDPVKTFYAGRSCFTIVSKGHLHLAAVSRLQETDSQLRVQLEALYMQILSTLTLPSMERMFLNRPSTDLSRPLEGSGPLLSALADEFTRGSPSTLLSALECLRMRKTERDAINRCMLKSRSADLLYGLIVAGGRLVSVLRPRKHSLHPGDLHLIFNMLFKARGIRSAGGEPWIPICLPGFNNTGYLYMYVSFLAEPANEDHDAREEQETEQAGAEAEDIAVILISNRHESFHEMKSMREELIGQLQKNGSLEAMHSAVRKGRPATTDIIPGTVMRHFLYKSRANVQFTMPSAAPHFDTGITWRRLMTHYANLHASVHERGSNLKIHHSLSRNYLSLAWISPILELYCVATPSTTRTALAQSAHKLASWAAAEEQRLFVIGGAVF